MAATISTPHYLVDQARRRFTPSINNFPGMDVVGEPMPQYHWRPIRRTMRRVLNIQRAGANAVHGPDRVRQPCRVFISPAGWPAGAWRGWEARRAPMSQAKRHGQGLAGPPHDPVYCKPGVPEGPA